VPLQLTGSYQEIVMHSLLLVFFLVFRVKAK